MSITTTTTQQHFLNFKSILGFTVNTMPKQKDLLHNAGFASCVKLGENARTAFSTLSDAMNAVCIVNDMDFWQLTKLHKM